MILLTQQQKEKAANLILKYARAGGDKALQDTIDKLDFTINPQTLTPVVSTIVRNKVRDLIKDYTSGKGPYSLENTIEKLAKTLRDYSSFTANYPSISSGLGFNIPLKPTSTTKPLQVNKYSASTSRFSQSQINALSLKEISTLQEFKDVIESVIDDKCIHNIDIKVDAYGDHSYHVEFTDIGKNVILFQYSNVKAGRGLEPAEIILGIFKSFYDSYTAACSGILKYDHLTGKIEVM